eukprot:3434410-Amphidinium_carterae.1
MSELCSLSQSTAEMLVLVAPFSISEDKLKTLSEKCQVPLVCAALQPGADGSLQVVANCQEPWVTCTVEGLGNTLSSWCWAQPEHLLHALALSLSVVECRICKHMLQHSGEEVDAFAALSKCPKPQQETSKQMLIKLIQEELTNIGKKVPLQRRCITRDGDTEQIRGLTFGFNLTRGRGVNKTNESESRILELIHALAVFRSMSEPYAGIQVNVMTAGQSIAAHVDRTEAHSWSIAFGQYSGGTLQIESNQDWKDLNSHMQWKRIRHDTRHRVTPVSSGVRVSIVLFVRKGLWKSLGRHEKVTLWRQGFPVYEAEEYEAALERKERKPKEQNRDLIERAKKDMDALQSSEAVPRSDAVEARVQLQRLCDGTLAKELRETKLNHKQTASARGCFFVIEGVDGNDTKRRATELAQWIARSGCQSHLCAFPDLSTGLGRVINACFMRQLEVPLTLLVFMCLAERWMTAQKILRCDVCRKEFTWCATDCTVVLKHVPNKQGESKQLE